MKKNVLIFLLILLIFTGCSSQNNNVISPGTISSKSKFNINPNDDITIEIKDNSLSESGAILIVNNKTDQQLFWNGYWKIEKEENGEWYRLKLIEEMNGDFSIAPLNTDGERTLDIFWEPWYGKLPKGKYRFVIRVSHNEEMVDKFYISAEFNL